MKVGRRAAALVVAATLAVVVTGCTSSGDLDAGPPPTTAASTTTSPTTTAPPTTADPPTTAPPTTSPAFEAVAALGRGISIGNALEAPREGDWGPGLTALDFETIADAGFDHVRLPIRWAAYTDPEPPYSIPTDDDPTIDHPDYRTIWERVDWAVEQAATNGLMIILDMHHDDAANDDPEANEERLVAMWDQIGTHYADAGGHVVFELFNEPHGGFTAEPERWNELAARLLATVRRTNPDRTVLIGPVDFNAIDRLDELELPDDDHVIATVHLYEPFAFTHQGAPWVEPTPPSDIDWESQAVSWAPTVRDRSWETGIVAGDDGLIVDFDRQGAGLGFEVVDPIDLAELRIEVEGSAELGVMCGSPGELVEQERLTTTSDPATVTIDLTGCLDQVGFVALVNVGTESEPLVVSDLLVCSDVVCRPAVSSAADSLRTQIGQAAAWSETTGVPVHIGEFGVYADGGDVPIEDRAAWTDTVVDAAVANGMAFSYWEFRSGFGAWDPEEQRWLPELRSALLD